MCLTKPQIRLCQVLVENRRAVGVRCATLRKRSLEPLSVRLLWWLVLFLDLEGYTRKQMCAKMRVGFETTSLVDALPSAGATGEVRAAEAVVCNASIWDAANLLPKEDVALDEMREDWKATPQTRSYLHLHLGLDATGLRVPARVVPEPSQLLLLCIGAFEDLRRDDLRQVKMTFPLLFTGAVPGSFCCMSASQLPNFLSWAEFAIIVAKPGRYWANQLRVDVFNGRFKGGGIEAMAGWDDVTAEQNMAHLAAKFSWSISAPRQGHSCLPTLQCFVGYLTATWTTKKVNRLLSAARLERIGCLMSQAVVIRNTFLEVSDQGEPERSENFRRQVSEPVKIFSSSPKHGEGEDSDEDFAAAKTGGLRADAPAFESASHSAMAIPPDMTMQQGYVQTGMKPRQGKGNRQKNDGSQVWGRPSQEGRQTEHRDPPKRTRDGQLSRLKDEDITHLEPPWENVTTVMMRNLPNKYTQQMLLGELRDAGFHMQEDFDFFYLPMDHCNCANLGYCFINFTKTARANDFAGAFSGKRMRRFNSHKTAVIMPASIQGYEQNYTYYISTRVAQAADPQYRPLFLRPLPSVDMNAPAPTSGKGKGGSKDRGKDGRGGRGRRKGGDWDLGEASMLGGGDWSSKDEDNGRVIPPQIPAAPVQQDYQVMCAACGTLCGSSYRFCSFCGNYLCDTGMAGPVMMAAYFQPTEWQMMPEQPQMTEQSPVAVDTDDMPTFPSKSSGKKETNKIQQEETPADNEPPAEELDILHGRMMLLAALKVAGSNSKKLPADAQD
ncbi:ML2 [Symbiodinium natans]|uniref:ML2 protein n=1 Tax=Symbiodinium natans TaxID=878477 RepID=A0A812QFN9_9DINO|nr:ML2 [Symbiodinium natans]